MADEIEQALFAVTRADEPVAYAGQHDSRRPKGSDRRLDSTRRRVALRRISTPSCPTIREQQKLRDAVELP